MKYPGRRRSIMKLNPKHCPCVEGLGKGIEMSWTPVSQYGTTSINNKGERRISSEQVCYA